MSLRSILQNSARSLNIFSTAIEVSSHNISNAGTEGYIRERLQIDTAAPYPLGNLSLGTGAEITGIRQEIDVQLESRLHTATGEAASSSIQLAVLQRLESELQELSGNDFSTALSQFVNALDDLSNQPADGPLRSIAINEGQQLAETLSGLRVRVDRIGTEYSGQQDSLIEEVNSLISSIAAVTEEIRLMEGNGVYNSEAGALRTQRYTALNRLSELIPIEYHEQPNGAISVYTDDTYLILDAETQQLELTTLTTDETRQVIQFSETGNVFDATGGELGGIRSAINDILGGFNSSLDELARGLIQQVNRIHSSGTALVNRTELTALHAVEDTTVPLSAAGLAFDVEHGSFEIKITDQASGAVTTTTISVDLDGIGTDTSLDDLTAALDAVDGISASTNTRGELELTADAGSEFGFANDNSGVLAALGLNSFFAGTSSSDIRVNADLIDNHDLLATGQGAGPGDNTNILQLAGFASEATSALGERSVEEFYLNIVTEVARDASSQQTRSTATFEYRLSLQSQREQISGVNLDEETVNLLTFQKNYQAVARVISTSRELLDVLLNL